VYSLSVQATHIPYRDSKLTRVLQHSLGGNARTVIIINCSPAASNARESVSSLRFGSRALHVRNRPVINRQLNVNDMTIKLAVAEARIRSLNTLLAAASRELFVWRSGGRVASEDFANLDLSAVEAAAAAAAAAAAGGDRDGADSPAGDEPDESEEASSVATETPVQAPAAPLPSPSGVSASIETLCTDPPSEQSRYAHVHTQTMGTASAHVHVQTDDVPSSQRVFESTGRSLSRNGSMSSDPRRDLVPLSPSNVHTTGVERRSSRLGVHGRDVSTDCSDLPADETARDSDEEKRALRERIQTLENEVCCGVCPRDGPCGLSRDTEQISNLQERCTQAELRVGEFTRQDAAHIGGLQGEFLRVYCVLWPDVLDSS
jgi:hypothetical protein